MLSTQVTVPQVKFTTNSPVSGSAAPSVGLAAGSPAPAAATPTSSNSPIAASAPAPAGGAPGPVYGTGFNTVVASTGFVASSQPTGPAAFKGAAGRVAPGMAVAAVMAVMGFAVNM